MITKSRISIISIFLFLCLSTAYFVGAQTVVSASIACNGSKDVCNVNASNPILVTWSCGNSVSGSVSNNGDSTVWSGTSGSQTLGGLIDDTIFFLTCNGTNETATSNILINVVSGTPTDITPPGVVFLDITVVSLSLTRIAWEVTDSGGSFLDRVSIDHAPFNTVSCTDTNRAGCNWTTVAFVNSIPNSNDWGSAIHDSLSIPGQYVYRIRVFDNAGNMTIYPPPPPPPTPLTVSPTSGTAPLAASFSAAGLNPSGYYGITYGDNANSGVIQAPPCTTINGCTISSGHTYSAAGTYTATLYSHNPMSTCAQTFCGSILATATIQVSSATPTPTPTPTPLPSCIPNPNPTSITWQNPVNVSVSGSSIIKLTPSANGWDAGASSVQSIPSGNNGYVEFSLGINTFAGLSNGDSNANYPDIDFGIQGGPNYTNTLAIYENGVHPPKISGLPYSSSDIFRVAVESGVVKYYQNGNLLYTSSKPPTFPLLLDTSIYAYNSSVRDGVIVSSPISCPTSPPPPPGPQSIGGFLFEIPNPFAGSINTFDDLINAIILFLYYIAGPIIVAMIVLAGLFFLFGRGEPNKVEAGKKILFYAVIGLIIILIGRGFIELLYSILRLGTET